MKLCMVGVRGHYGYVLQDLEHLPDVRVVGVCSGTPEDSPEPLVKACQRLGHCPRQYADYQRMLDEVRPQVLAISGPLDLHARVCTEACSRGIHVLCEKPVALTWPELATLEEAVRQSGVHLAAMMGLRYEPAFFAAWRAVRAGAVGQVRMIHAQKSYRLGARPPYYRSRSTYGGTIPWVGSHAIDLIHWFAAAGFVSVCAAHSTVGNRDHGDLEVSAACQFVLAGDVFGTASIDYLRPGSAPSHGDDRVRVAGTDGVIEVRDGKVLLIAADSGPQPLVPACPHRMLVDFVQQVEGHRQALIGPEETLTVTRACLLARDAADRSQLLRF